MPAGGTWRLPCWITRHGLMPSQERPKGRVAMGTARNPPNACFPGRWHRMASASRRSSWARPRKQVDLMESGRTLLTCALPGWRTRSATSHPDPANPSQLSLPTQPPTGSCCLGRQQPRLEPGTRRTPAHTRVWSQRPADRHSSPGQASDCVQPFRQVGLAWVRRRAAILRVGPPSVGGPAARSAQVRRRSPPGETAAGAG